VSNLLSSGSNHYSEGRMRLPSTFRAALGSLSIKSNIFCKRLRSAIKQKASIDLC